MGGVSVLRGKCGRGYPLILMEDGNDPQVESKGLWTAFASIERLFAFGYGQEIAGFHKRDFYWMISIYPNMGSLCLMFLRNPLIDTSFGKQQDLELHAISVYLGKSLSAHVFFCNT